MHVNALPPEIIRSKGQLVLVYVGNHEAHAGGTEPLSNCKADAARGARDYRNAIR
ncbi:hypothetical protein FHT02_003701 [Sphingomonas xinjiangensis]|uniref:Uncharacterized protein n=1 Tax=Sphingomonas xinjiangensis TaxID=643568 RepID=A0A840YRZ6_9SPHN|nr:hypothetical protein [Sphingomonas xinjiangensis]